MLEEPLKYIECFWPQTDVNQGRLFSSAIILTEKDCTLVFRHA